MKIRQLGDELLHADGQIDRRTDMTKLTVAFLNFSILSKFIFKNSGFQILV
jgi:hypothetical protein